MIRYDLLKPEVQGNRVFFTFYKRFLDGLINMFTWRPPENHDEINPRFLEKWLHEAGSFGCFIENNKYYFGIAPSRAGKLDQYGDGTEMTITVSNIGKSFRGKIWEKCAICYNNTMRIPDFELDEISSELNQIVISTNTLIKNTRYAPLIKANDDKFKKAIENALKGIADGVPQIVVTKDVFEQWSTKTGENESTLELTDPDRVKNIEYLNSMYDTTRKRFWSVYGMDVNTIDKMAQQSVDEIKPDDIDFHIPLSMLNERKTFCEKMTEISGEKWDVEFSPLWQKAYENFLSKDKTQAETEKIIAETEQIEEVENDVETIETEEKDVETVENNVETEEKGETENDNID